MEFYSATMKNEILSFAGKRMELKNSSESQGHTHMWHIDPIQVQQYYEKQVTLRGGHLLDREGKRRKLRR
jgi:hypothetical protein